MHTRLLGSIEVSEIGMGCMGFSHGYGKVPDEATAIDAIRAAHDAGCTLFDTAESYGREQFHMGHNEELVGKALAPFRDEVAIATKFHLGTAGVPEGGKLDGLMREHLEASLKRLGTDHVELYYLHRLNEFVPIEKIAEVMGRFIDEGLIRGWGLSQVDAATVRAAHAVTPLSAVQNIYSMVERDCEREIFPTCLELGIGVVPFSPIASGLLSGKVTAATTFEGDDVRKFVPQLSAENLAANQPIVDLLASFAERKGATSAQISLAWMLRKYPNVVPIPGSKNKGRILENLGAWKVELTDAEFSELEAALDACEVHGHRGTVESEQRTFSDNWIKR